MPGLPACDTCCHTLFSIPVHHCLATRVRLVLRSQLLQYFRPLPLLYYKHRKTEGEFYLDEKNSDVSVVGSPIPKCLILENADEARPKGWFLGLHS